MLFGILLDVALVLYLQITREAIQTAVSFTLSPLAQTHIFFSTGALLLYPAVLFYGIRLARDLQNQPLRKRHKRIALTAFVLRTLGFLFMFSLLE
jgi:hypothetical protein